MKLALTDCGNGYRWKVISNAAEIHHSVSVQMGPGDDATVFCENEDAVKDFRREVTITKQDAEDNPESADAPADEVIDACEFVLDAIDDAWG